MTALSQAIAGLSGLVGYWPCSDGAGTTVADSASSPLSLTVQSGGTLGVASIVPGDAAGTCLIGNAVSANNPANKVTSLDGSGSGYTLAAFVSPQDIISAGSASARYAFQMPFGTGVFFRGNSAHGKGRSVQVDTPGEMIAAHGLYLCVFRASPSTVSLSLNGQTVASGTPGATGGNVNLYAAPGGGNGVYPGEELWLQRWKRADLKQGNATRPQWWDGRRWVPDQRLSRRQPDPRSPLPDMQGWPRRPRFDISAARGNANNGQPWRSASWANIQKRKDAKWQLACLAYLQGGSNTGFVYQTADSPELLAGGPWVAAGPSPFAVQGRFGAQNYGLVYGGLQHPEQVFSGKTTAGVVLTHTTGGASSVPDSSWPRLYSLQ